MAEYRPVPSTYLSPLERPRCPKCVQARMSLSQVETGPLGFDRRTFECQKCGHVLALVIASDPMESSVRGWLSSELSSPL
jgi:transposase